MDVKLTREADIGPQIVKNHFSERGRFFLSRITSDRKTGKLRRCARRVAPVTEMRAEWSLAARIAPVGEIWCAQVERSRGHFVSVGGGFSNWREICKALYLVNGCDPMDAAPQLNLNALGLDADQLRALQEQMAAARNAAEVRAAPPPLFGPGAAPPQPRAAAPVNVQGPGDAPAQGPVPPGPQPPPRRGRGRPRGARSRRPALDPPRAHQRRRADGGGAGDGDSQVSGTDDEEERAPVVDAEEDVDDLYLDGHEVLRNAGDLPYVLEEVPVLRAVLRDLRSGEREEPTLPPCNKGPTAAKNVPDDCTSAFSILKLLLNASLIDRMCEYANAYANESVYANTRRAQRWHDVVPAEMWVWISCVLFIGVCKINNRECAWDRSSPFYQPWLASKMSRRAVREKAAR